MCLNTLYLITDDQLCTNRVDITASSNQERDRVARDVKERGGKSSLGTVILN